MAEEDSEDEDDYDYINDANQRKKSDDNLVKRYNRTK